MEMFVWKKLCGRSCRSTRSRFIRKESPTSMTSRVPSSTALCPGRRSMSRSHLAVSTSRPKLRTYDTPAHGLVRGRRGDVDELQAISASADVVRLKSGVVEEACDDGDDRTDLGRLDAAAPQVDSVELLVEEA